METKLNIMDLEVDLISQDTFVSKIFQFLSHDNFSMIFLLNMKMLEEATKNPEYKEILKKSDLLLPGEDTILSLHNVDMLQLGGMIVDYKCLNKMLEEIRGQNRLMYLVGDKEHQLQTFMDYCEKTYPDTRISGAYCINLESSPETIINEINGMDADILMVIMESPFQEQWIIDNCGRTNTKLCIGIGGVVSDMIKEKKEAPALLKTLHLESVYYFFVKNKKFAKVQKARIFKKQVAHYKNKKGE